MQFFFSPGKHRLNLQSCNKTGHRCGKESYLKQPDVPVELQELIPVKNTLPYISFGWEWSEACEASGNEQGGGPEATRFFWCRLMHDSSPCAKYVFFFSWIFPKSWKGTPLAQIQR